jgi:hypothetical protein
MRGDTLRAVPKVPCVVAALCIALTIYAAWSMASQFRGAQRIDASPMRVQGVVDRITYVNKGVEVRVSYDAAGRRYSTEGLPVDRMPDGLAVGTRVCLEAAADHPSTVRLCGQRYPAGDDWPPTFLLLIVAGTAGTLLALGFAVSGIRAHRAHHA